MPSMIIKKKTRSNLKNMCCSLLYSMLRFIFNLIGICNNNEEGDKKPEPVILMQGTELNGTCLCIGQCNCIH